MNPIEVGRGLVVSRDITPQLVKVLKVTESAEVTETCLELITNLAETGKFFFKEFDICKFFCYNVYEEDGKRTKSFLFSYWIIHWKNENFCIFYCSTYKVWGFGWD